MSGVVAQLVQRPRRRTVTILFSAYFLALFLSVMPPFFSFVNRMEPSVFGLSFVLFWTLFVGVMMALGLSALYWIECKRGEVVG
ncbi:hypothetical protein [Halegenticoccus soli]|uniref:hypothetical protein n=1 Tax=Halegenticoccus soli TaxID=1985678 RepID=UPI00117B7117|nr:hypothetical protein [Halegenticoccus soli]